jgi:hypothetical protein
MMMEPAQAPDVHRWSTLSVLSSTQPTADSPMASHLLPLQAMSS